MPERFWYIHVHYQEPAAAQAAPSAASTAPPPSSSSRASCSFVWARNRLFDEALATLLYEVCPGPEAAPTCAGAPHSVMVLEAVVAAHDGRSSRRLAEEQALACLPVLRASMQACVEPPIEARVVSVRGQQRLRHAPVPLSTLELQKRATQYLRLPGEPLPVALRAMAERSHASCFGEPRCGARHSTVLTLHVGGGAAQASAS